MSSPTMSYTNTRQIERATESGADKVRLPLPYRCKTDYSGIIDQVFDLGEAINGLRGEEPPVSKWRAQ